MEGGQEEVCSVKPKARTPTNPSMAHLACITSASRKAINLAPPPFASPSGSKPTSPGSSTVVDTTCCDAVRRLPVLLLLEVEDDDEEEEGGVGGLTTPLFFLVVGAFDADASLWLCFLLLLSADDAEPPPLRVLRQHV